MRQVDHLGMGICAEGRRSFWPNHGGKVPQEMDWLMEEWIARNQATFRAANERIGAAAGVYDVATPVPFICECADPTCTEVVLLELDQYEEIRSDSVGS